jgi:hypothetical protein
MSAFLLYSFPKELVSTWWIPMQRAGYHVELLAPEYVRRASSNNNSSRTEYFGIVSFDQETVDVMVLETIAEGEEDPRYDVVLPSGSSPLNNSVLRILVASGMPITPKPSNHFEQMYDCSEILAATWNYELSKELSFRTERGMDQYRVQEIDIQPNDFINGVVSGGGHKIKIYTGPRYDAKNGVLRCYFAISHVQNVVFQHKSLSDAQFTACLSAWLLKNGAMRINTDNRR